MKQSILQYRALANRIGPTLIVALLLILLAILHIKITRRTDMPYLIGDRCEAMFDLWSFQHFFSGVLIGSFLAYVRVPSNRVRFALLMIVCALCWEATELAMEAGLFGHVITSWKGGYEHWANRFIGDPFMVTLGGFLAHRFKPAWKWVLVPTLIWLGLNIASPNSMYIQRLVFGQ